MDNDKVGHFIAKLRKKKGLTQDELGNMLGISGKSVSKWERGLNMPDISLIYKLSEVFDVDLKMEKMQLSRLLICKMKKMLLIL